MDERVTPATASTRPMLAVLAAQLASGVVLAAVFWGFSGSVAGYSAFLGSLICVLPNTFLALRLALPSRDAQGVLRAAWIGELGKIGLTVVLFVLVLSLVRPLAYLPLFAAFIVAQLMVFAGLLVTDTTGTDTRHDGG